MTASAAAQALATVHHGTSGRLEMAWEITDFDQTTDALIAAGHARLQDLITREGVVVLGDDWVIKGPWLSVTCAAVWWPDGDPVRVSLQDDVPTDALSNKQKRR